MRSAYEIMFAEQEAIQRTIMRGGAALVCGGLFGRVCKLIWPTKTAEHLAAEVGCCVRTAVYEISGERHPSAQSLIVIMGHLVPEYRGKGHGNGNGSLDPRRLSGLEKEK